MCYYVEMCKLLGIGKISVRSVHSYNSAKD